MVNVRRTLEKNNKIMREHKKYELKFIKEDKRKIAKIIYPEIKIKLDIKLKYELERLKNYPDDVETFIFTIHKRDMKTIYKAEERPYTSEEMSELLKTVCQPIPQTIATYKFLYTTHTLTNFTNDEYDNIVCFLVKEYFRRQSVYSNAFFTTSVGNHFDKNVLSINVDMTTIIIRPIKLFIHRIKSFFKPFYNIK